MESPATETMDAEVAADGSVRADGAGVLAFGSGTFTWTSPVPPGPMPAAPDAADGEQAANEQAAVDAQARAQAALDEEADEQTALDDGLSGTGRYECARGSLPVSVELASYVTVAAIALGATALARATWATLGAGGRFGLAGLTALIGLSAGSGVMAIGDRSSRRLGGLLWAMGTVGLAWAVAVPVAGALPAGSHDGGVALAGGTTAVVVGALLWRNRPVPLQLLTVLAGLATIGVGVVRLSGLHPAAGTTAGIAWIAAVLLAGLAGAGLIRPGPTAAGIAGITAVAAGSVVTMHHLALGLALALAGVTVSAAALYALVHPHRHGTPPAHRAGAERRHDAPAPAH